jgi:transposase
MRMGRSKHRQKPAAQPGPQRREVDPEALTRILDALRGNVAEEDYQILQAALETLIFITLELERKDATIGRLRRWLFGATTERTDQVCPEAETEAEAPAASAGEGEAGPAPKDRPRRKGDSHGRNGRKDFPGAQRVKVPVADLKPGDPCPECPKGKVYPLKEPKVLIRVKGMAPFDATIFELERMRCNLCGEVFTAQAPEGVGEDKYDASAAAMVGLLKYDAGLPFNRLEKLQKALGIPLPATTQWELVEEAAEKLEPALAELIRQAAQGELLHNDDTTMRILDLPPMLPLDADDQDRGRTGVYTSGIIARTEGHSIALFLSGHQHAGENLADVLRHRAENLPPPIHMCDALPHNRKGIGGTLLAHCLAHARRNFVEVEPGFPEEVRHVLVALRDVYHNDSQARDQGLDAEARLRFHQEQSGPVMEDLKEWLQGQVDEKRVEPASGLGRAIAYMLKHWDPLTLFLRVPGAVLDNNIAERALKKAVLHRKNALFYRTDHGAAVGDLFMSLTHTAALNQADPFAYLVALLRHAEAVAAAPAGWMPWNYRERLSEREKASA